MDHCPPGGCKSMFGIEPINGYGCWCNFGNDLLKGMSAPVNEIDGICRNLQLCLRCARWDGRNDPNSYVCEPADTAYQAKQVGSHYEVNCSGPNSGDACATHVCSCNYNFIVSLFKLIFQQYVHDPQYKHLDSNGNTNWSWDGNCYNEPNINGDGNTECCGFYPDRYPFNANSETKACCAAHYLYNPIDQDCCNGQVEPEGSC